MLLGGLTTTCVALAGTNAIHGLWIEPETGGSVKLYACEDGVSLCGRIISLPQGKQRLDENNPDPALRERDLVGLEILQDFKPVATGVWEGGGEQGRIPGRIYLPVNGDTLGDAKNTY